MISESCGCFATSACRTSATSICWLPVEQCSGDNPPHLFRPLPRRFNAFQWHGETYDLPAETTHLASSGGCPIQAFEHPYGLGLQFHLEMTPDGVSDLLRECSSDIGSGPYEQTPSQILADTNRCAASEKLLVQVLNGIETRIECASRVGL